MAQPIQYDSKQKQIVHQLMEAVLKGDALDGFIAAHYPAVAQHITPNTGRATKIRYTIEFAARQGQLGKLTEHVQQVDPAVFQAFVQGARQAPPPDPEEPVRVPEKTVVPKSVSLTQAEIVPTSPEIQALAQAEDLLKRSLADRYRITEVLDTSGRGAVFRAIDTKTDLEVAIKVIDLTYLPLAVQERIRQDTRLAMRLDHPGIVQVFDFGQVDQLFYIVMEFVFGANLQQVRQSFTALSKKTILPQIIRLIYQLCLTVDYMHHQEILHPSLMPDNIMLKPSPENEELAWQPVLINFALLRPHRESLASAVEIPTDRLTYQVSPELLLGHATDIRSDVYALGILLDDLVVGQPPFRPANLRDAVRLHVEMPPSPPRAVNPDIPENLERVILKALAKDPADRYLSAKGLAQALAECLESPELPSPPPLAAADVSLFMDTSRQLIVTPGSTLTATVTLRNDGGQDDHCQVRVQGVPPNWVSVTPAATTLLPGETQEVKISIQPPLSSLSRTGTHALVIQVISQKHLGQSNDIQRVLTVGTFSRFQCSLWPQELEDDQMTQLTVENYGNSTETVTIRPQPDEKLQFEPEQAQFQIGPGEIERVDFRVAPRSTPLIGRTTQTTFSFQLTSSLGSTEKVSGQLTYRATIATQWVLAGILAVALFVCAMIAVLPAIMASLNPTPTPAPTLTPLPTVASTPVQPAIVTVIPVPTVAPPTATPNLPPTSLPTVPAVTAIPVASPTPQLPTAIISGPNRGIVGQSITFSGATSQPGSSAITTYNWDFGDGTQSSGITVSHIYQNVGSYQVTLTVINQQGFSNASRLGIQITQ
jgi:serine/threonine protein kinase